MSEGRDFNPAALGSKRLFAAGCMNDRFGHLQPFVFFGRLSELRTKQTFKKAANFRSTASLDETLKRIAW